MGRPKETRLSVQLSRVTAFGSSNALEFDEKIFTLLVRKIRFLAVDVRFLVFFLPFDVLIVDISPITVLLLTHLRCSVPVHFFLVCPFMFVYSHVKSVIDRITSTYVKNFARRVFLSATSSKPACVAIRHTPTSPPISWFTVTFAITCHCNENAVNFKGG